MNDFLDITEIVKRVIKYLIEGFVVAIVAYVLPKQSLNVEEIMLIALTAAATFSILDTYMPASYVQMKNGIGLGLGLQAVGF